MIQRTQLSSIAGELRGGGSPMVMMQRGDYWSPEVNSRTTITGDVYSPPCLVRRVGGRSVSVYGLVRMWEQWISNGRTLGCKFLSPLPREELPNVLVDTRGLTLCFRPGNVNTGATLKRVGASSTTQRYCSLSAQLPG